MIFLFRSTKTVFALSLLFASAAHALPNKKPIANAGVDQTVSFSSIVTLSGKQSSDEDGLIKSYQWTQTSGKKILLNNAKTATATFTSPATPSTLAFKLTVKDNKNASATDTLTITTANQPLCELPFVMENNRCVDKTAVAPKPVTVICVPPKVLDHELCVDKTQKPVDDSCKLPQIAEKGQCVDKSSPLQLNDTGITFCSDGAFNVEHCAIANYPHQDGESGRDVLVNDNADGHAGFSFTKLSATGTPLPRDATLWSCVKDNVTGLIWENKTPSNATLTMPFSETAAFVQSQNTQALCGLRNWRLPSIHELQSIVDYSVPLPNVTLDTAFFPYSNNSIYWSQTAYVKHKNEQWSVYFNDGSLFEQAHSAPAAVRLVSDTPPRAEKKYIISDNGEEVLDLQTNLIWRRCVEGMRWSGQTCVDESLSGPTFFMFQEALQHAVYQADQTKKAWRLPNIKELTSLMDYSQADMAIDSTVFPSTPNAQAWSSSSYSADAFYSWIVHFYYGKVYFDYTEDMGTVRLVR
ncbi:MAG TPA: hypothetical protein DF614_04540 [Methylococcaceae bacterium]|nr:hypothetical protein [Methylococcaceae bacterium]